MERHHFHEINSETGEGQGGYYYLANEVDAEMARIEDLYHNQMYHLVELALENEKLRKELKLKSKK